MPGYDLRLNGFCDPKEKEEALRLARTQLLDSFDDIEYIIQKDGGIAFRTREKTLDSVVMRRYYRFRDIFPWFDVCERALQKPEMPAFRGKITRFASRHYLYDVDWQRRQVIHHGLREPRPEPLADEPEGLYPSCGFLDEAEMGSDDSSLLILPKKQAEGVNFQDVEAMRPFLMVFVRNGNALVRNDGLLDAAFSYRMPDGGNPWEYIRRGEFHGLQELPSDFGGGVTRCDIAEWFPAAARHAPVPETAIFPVPGSMGPLLDQKKPACFASYCSRLARYAKSKDGLLFLRSGQTSGKHSFARTCRLGEGDDIGEHLSWIVEFCGLADLPCENFALREWLPGPAAWDEPSFLDMPVRREFRLFVEGGRLSHAQPYWPAEAFSADCERPDGWEGLLAGISTLPRRDFEQMANMSLAIAADLGGDWSLDWLSTDRGWYLTDMAVAGLSYRTGPEGFEHLFS